MASCALDKLINTRYRRFSESNFLLCKQSLWHESNKNFETNDVEHVLLLFALSLGDNDANQLMLISNAHSEQRGGEKNARSRGTHWDLCQRCKKHCAKVCDERIFIYKSNIGVNCPSVFVCVQAFAGDFVEILFFTSFVADRLTARIAFK